MRRLLGIAWVGLLLAAMALAATIGAQVASAHAARVSADPADNAVLATGPERVTTFVAMTVVGPDGNLWSTGEPAVAGPVASIGMRALGPAGTYTVNYRVTSADGHVVSGSWSFRLTVAGTGTPGPAAAATSADNGIPAWPFALVAVMLIGAGCVWAVRRSP